LSIPFGTGGADADEGGRVGQSLSDILDQVAAGCYPPADGGVTILSAQPAARAAGVISFTAHAVVFIDADRDWVKAQLPPGDLSAPLTPAFLEALCQRTGRKAQSTDVLTLATAQPGEPEIDLKPLTAPAGGGPVHPRLERAHRYREDVLAWQADGGIVTLGRGIGGRWEAAVEVDPDRQGRGLGRRLALAARHLVPGGATLWAQIAPGNVASMRAFLAAGYVPAGAEALLIAARN
jgi:GNAT superfamily N-acetyltransferase